MKDCLSCKWFKSFRDDYFDEQEPDDQGFCNNGNSQFFGNEGAGAGVSCDFHEVEDKPVG